MKHKTGTRDEWRKARLELLKAEKEHTRRGDDLARQRQLLPWVRVDKDYRFDTDAGPATLRDLFRGRSQLLVYHFMFGPDYKAGCPSCSMIADGFEGITVHLANHDVAFSAVSLAPLPKLQAYKRRMNWTFPWASSGGSDFNFDFNTSVSPEKQRDGDVEYNYAPFGAPAKESDYPDVVKQFAASAGVGASAFLRQLPGMSSFAMQDGDVYHTYSAYARGLDGLWNALQWLDRAPLGRNETNGVWWKRHDEYSA